MINNLNRFIDAQHETYSSALSEIQKGKKTGHWMWYIFPQLKGLGFSDTAKFYGIKNIDEAQKFLVHPDLGERFIAICKQLLQLDSSDATKIFGTPDDMKLRSSMTLFACVPNADPVFQSVLNKYFKGSKDEHTLRIIGHCN